MYKNRKVIKVVLKKTCKCGCIIAYEDKYCPKCAKEMDSLNKKRYKDYQCRRKQDEEQKKYQDFYNTKEWLMLRDHMRRYYIGMDWLEYYRTGEIVEGYTVHHIVPLEDDYSKRLSKDNLIYLSDSNHKRVHSEYKTGKRAKENMQKILIEVVDKFNKEYKRM